MEYVQELVDDFIDFLATRKDENDQLTDHLTEYLDEWIKWGNAIELVGGDHARFLCVALLIADRLVNQPEDFRGHGDQIGKFVAFVDADDKLPICMDPGYWDLFVFRRKYGEERGPKS